MSFGSFICAGANDDKRIIMTNKPVDLGIKETRYLLCEFINFKKFKYNEKLLLLCPAVIHN